MQKFLITGGAGFIGSHLAETLLKNQKTVFVIDDLSTGSLKNLEHLHNYATFKFIQESVYDSRWIKELVAEVDFIYHLAAAVGVNLVVQSPVHTIRDNIRSAEIVLDAASWGKKGILLTSTSEVYGKSTNSPFKETDDLLIGPPIFSRWSYACSKLLDEFLAFAYYREKGVPIYIARLFNTVGPKQSGRYGMVIPRFVEQALRGLPIEIYGDGKQTRCFCHVNDVVRALVSLPTFPQAVGEVYNVGNIEEVTIIELAKRIKKLSRSDSPLTFIPYEAAYMKGFEDMRRRVPNIDKIQRLTGWQSQKTLDEIILETIDYIKSIIF